MHLLATDRLTCPRCGPEFGLILLADRLEDRRVLEGAFGCSNCRERFPIENGFGDLRPAPRSQEPAADLPTGEDPEGGWRLGALLGVTEGPALLLLTGDAVRHAGRLAALAEGIEVFAAHPALRAESEAVGVNRLAIGARFPFPSGRFRGVVLEGASGASLLAEGVRILAPGSRVVLFDPPPGADALMEGGGLSLLLEAESVLVGARNG